MGHTREALYMTHSQCQKVKGRGPKVTRRSSTKTSNITGGRSSTSVNCDIAIQWEWSNFDPSQNQNPVTDYDKTLHNWLCPRYERVNQNLCHSAVRVRLGKYVKYNTEIFFSPDSPTEVILWRIFTHNDSNYAQSRKEVPFWGLHDGRPHLGVKFPKNAPQIGKR